MTVGSTVSPYEDSRLGTANRRNTAVTGIHTRLSGDKQDIPLRGWLRRRKPRRGANQGEDR
jgi:hypothetical protein